MKNLFNISLFALFISAITACSGTRDAASGSTSDTTAAMSNNMNSDAAGLTASSPNLNTPDQPTGMAIANEQAALIDTISPDIFLNQATAIGLKKMELGKIAQTKAQHPEIKAYAKSMVDDHAKITAGLVALAKMKNIVLPITGADIKNDAEKLQAVGSDSFDDAYTTIMISDHDKAVLLFEQAAKSSDKEISDYAKQELPALRALRTKAGDLNKK